MPDFKSEISLFLKTIYNNILAFEQKQLAKTNTNLTINEVHIIDQIGLDGEKKMTDVAEKMGITLATMTAAADRLEQKGCIVRERSKTDRRIVLLSLTRNGKVTFMMHERFHLRMVDKVVASMSDEEMAVLTKAIMRINDFFVEEH